MRALTWWYSSASGPDSHSHPGVYDELAYSPLFQLCPFGRCVDAAARGRGVVQSTTAWGVMVMVLV